MMKCASFNINQTMWEIFVVFKATIQIYCQTLESRVVLLDKMGPDGFSEEQIKTACAVIGTLEYVDSTLPQLCDTVRCHISTDYHHQLDFDQEQEDIGALTSMIYLDVLVVSVQRELEPVLQTISRIPWYQYGDCETVSGGDCDITRVRVTKTSHFVEEIKHIMRSKFQIIQRNLSKLHYRFFCDKHAQWFIPRFIAEVYRCTRINKAGAKQLLLDTNSLKAILLETPQNAATAPGGNSKYSMPNAYSNYVLREISKIEFVFRVLSEENEAVARVEEVISCSNTTSAGPGNDSDKAAATINAVSLREVEKILSLKATGNLFEDQTAVLNEQRAFEEAEQSAAANRANGDFAGTARAKARELETVGKQIAAGAQSFGKNAQNLASDARKKFFGNMKFPG